MGFHGKALLDVTAYSEVGFFVDGATAKRFAFGEELSGSTNNALTMTEDQNGAGNWGGLPESPTRDSSVTAISGGLNWITTQEPVGLETLSY